MARQTKKAPARTLLE